MIKKLRDIKSMTQEEKAKAYDEAIKMTKEFLMSPRTCFDIEQLYDIFPELQESEDKKIMKGIKSILEHYKECGASVCPYPFVSIDEALTWLEKQGEKKLANKAESMEHSYITTNPEFFQWIYDRLKYVYNENPNVDYMLSLKERIEDMQKFTDNVEPKFKVGDWVVDEKGIVKEILSYKNGIYKHTDGYSSEMFEDGWRKWDISDARDGDVLYSPCSELLWIFKTKDTGYCSCNLYNNIGSICTDRQIITPIDAIPATKSQRDTLFAKMKESGYEWDDEKKELKKIEQQSAWMEEDIRNIQDIDSVLFYDKDLPEDTCMRLRNWLQSLKPNKDMIEALRTEYEKGRADVINEIKSSWSEKDENTIKVLRNIIRKSEMIDSIIYTDSLKEKLYDWIKILKQRCAWKPNDKQIEALENFVRSYGESGILSPYDNNTKLLYSLLFDLKNLNN